MNKSNVYINHHSEKGDHLLVDISTEHHEVNIYINVNLLCTVYYNL